MKKYKVASLFSGAGGLDLGFVRTGRYSVVFANEVLTPAATTYSRNFGLKLVLCNRDEEAEAQAGTVLACDVAHVSSSSLSGLDADVVLGGPPCQDFSIVRGPSWDRRGIEVRRGRLYAHFVRALVAVQPKAFVFENVPGLMSANGGLAYKVVLEDFEELKLRWKEVKKAITCNNSNSRVEGYEIAFSNTADFSSLGAPQKRERLIIIGVRKDLVKRDLEAFRCLKRKIDEVLSGRMWLFRRYPLTPIEVFEGRRLDMLEDAYREVMKKWEGVWEDVRTDRAREWKHKVWDRLTFSVIEDYKLANDIKQSGGNELEEALKQHEDVLRELDYCGRPICGIRPPDSTAELPREDAAVVERMKRIPPDENHEFVKGTKWEVEGKGISLVYRRIHPLKPSYTIAAYGGGGTHSYHYDRNRVALTLRERARLQTFPDSFLFFGRRLEVRAQIGEAVSPLAAQRIAEALAEALDSLA